MRYRVELRLPDGKSKRCTLEIGSDEKLPEAVYWDVSVSPDVSPALLRELVADIRRRRPPAIRVQELMTLTNDHLPALADLERLVQLTLNDVTDDGLREVARHSGLELLGVLDAEAVTDDGLAALRDLKSLRSLEFVLAGKITDRGLESLRDLISLQDLSMGENNGITGRGIQILLDLPCLHRVHLLSSGLTQEDYKELKALANRRSSSHETEIRSPLDLGPGMI